MLMIMYYYDETSKRFESPFTAVKHKSTPPDNYEQSLSQIFPFFNILDFQLKNKFKKRLEHFIKIHSFEGREGLAVTDEMRLLISAAAVRMTLGLNYYDFSLFPEILIYPDVYYSPFSKTHNKGETNPQGIIAFSWPHLVEGFKTESDHINLAYHEFAHALIFAAVSDTPSDSGFEAGYEMFSDALSHDHLSQKVYSLKIFRDYAFTNKMEFFAVAAENFMEAPRDLHDECYELYDILRHMLRQDPLTHQYGLHFTYDDFWKTDF
jgi:MtfA peptidase